MRPFSVAVCTGAGNVDENHFRIQARKSFRGGDGDAVGDVCVGFFRHAGGGDAEAEEAGVEAGELRFDRRIIPKIGVDDLAQLGISLAGGGAADRHNQLHVGIEKTFAQDALADHARCAEKQDVHGTIIVFFWVCGKD